MSLIIVQLKQLLAFNKINAIFSEEFFVNMLLNLIFIRMNISRNKKRVSKRWNHLIY